MKHLGDITQISGYIAPIVDCVIGGSPCQDLSVAGKRAGLAGERSGLYMDQIRIVKEMRERDRNSGRTGKFIRPRYMVWENVPGAFSSNKGQDFAAVIEEIIKVAEPDAAVSVCVPDRGWPKSGCYYAENGSWSVAWRVHDAQFWGVPQRRKRIALVADFGGLSAPEILFERKGLSGNTEQSGEERESLAAYAEGGTGADHREGAVPYTLKIRSGCEGDGKGALIQTDMSATLATNNDQYLFQPVMEAAGFKAGNGAKSNGIGWQEECAPSLTAGESGTNRTPAVFDARGNGDGETVCTLTGDHQNRVTDYTAIISTYQSVTGPLMANSHPGSYCGQDAYQDMFPVAQNIVRRLTPLECERLQGFPDGWTDIGEWVDSKGKKHKAADSPRYKALGNSIALPFWKYLIKRLCAQYERDATMASLFDGIGGFPLIWEQINGKGSCLWASEIEEFPIAVTKYHFGE